MHSRTPIARAYWMRAFLREKARRGIWDDRMLNGHPGHVTAAVQKYIMRGVAHGLVCTSTTDGQHARRSYHYTSPGRAADMGLRSITLTGARKRRAFQLAEAQHEERYDELYGPDNHANVRGGERIALAEGSALEAMHDNHVHGAPRY
jgi:hypothetical protein